MSKHQLKVEVEGSTLILTRQFECPRAGKCSRPTQTANI